MKCPDTGNQPRHGGPERSVLRAAVRRTASMALVWLGFGVVVGFLTAPQHSAIGIAAGILAGMIVLPPLGATLGAIGFRWKGSLDGGVLGLAGGTAFALVQGRPDAATVAGFGLIFGGLVGATVAAFVRFYCVLFGGIRRLARSDDRVDKPVAV
ncbi:MAG TPA: hypothetical protein VFG68_11850 [Fimbriiglobus sp.]|nr:hypothetical protein [Fimbriiglobus sp.]